MDENYRDDFYSTPTLITEDTVISMYNCMLTQVHNHVDFVNDFIESHQDFTTDITGLGKLTDEQLSQVLALEEQIKQMGAGQPTAQTPSWFNYPMTPVASSFIKGAGAYKGKLLLEFHHAPGEIFGYDVSGNGAEMFRELMYSGSKGGWVWDKILGKPSQFGMAKGKFFAYEDNNGQMKFYTTPGAQFVHHFGRPAKFTYNPVGYLSQNQSQYNATSLAGKAWKEALVLPDWSRNPIEPSLLREMQRNEAFQELIPEIQRIKTYEELQPLLEERIRFSTFQDIQERLKEKFPQKDFLTDLLEKQMTLIPIVTDLIEDYPVKGYWRTSSSGEMIFVRRHTRGEGTSIKDKPRMTSKRAQEKHEQAIYLKKFDRVKKKQEYYRRLAQKYITRKHVDRPSLETLMDRFDWNIEYINDSERRIKSYRKQIDDAREMYKKAGTKSGKEHWLEDIDYSERSINWNKDLIEEYKVKIDELKDQIKKRKKEEKELYFSRAELHEHFREIHELDSYLKFPARLHKNLKFAKDIDFMRYFESGNVSELDEALRFLPKKFQNAAEIRIYNQVTDDPDSLGDPEDSPQAYKDVGWTRKNREVSAEINYKHNRIRIKAQDYDARSSVWHEMGHAVHKNGQWDFRQIDSLNQMWIEHKTLLESQGKTGMYQYNNIDEFFAVQFERYYQEKWDIVHNKLHLNHEKPFPKVKEWFERNLWEVTIG